MGRAPCRACCLPQSIEPGQVHTPQELFCRALLGPMSSEGMRSVVARGRRRPAVGHFCGATATCLRKHGALGGRLGACPCSLHRQRRALILGSPVSGAFSRTGGARACAPRPWRMLGFGAPPCFVGGRWCTRALELAQRVADRLCSCPCSDFGAGGRFKGRFPSYVGRSKGRV